VGTDAGMDPELKRSLDRAFERIPQLSRVDAPDRQILRLGGLTNCVFAVTTPADRYVLRIPGKGTEAYIDRKVEAHNARLAGDAGVSARVLYFDTADGLMLSNYLDGCVTMSGELFRSRAGAPRRAAEAFNRLHSSGQVFHYRFELFAKIDEYLAHLVAPSIRFPDGYHAVLEGSSRIRTRLLDSPVALAPCHCDPLAENFLDDGAQMWLVDWEYSGMNDPAWDLADLSVEANFGPSEDEELLEAYFGGPVPPSQRGRFVIYKAMCDLLWTLWGLIQHANGNPAASFWDYSVERFERCRAAMGHAAFESHLAAIGR
jgi:thiamine kinase-like enzyme